MRLQDVAVRRTDLYQFAPKDLTVLEGFNVRLPGESLDEHIRVLANSIKEVGVQTPLTIRQDGETIYVVDGHCRLAAIKLAISEGTEIVSVPCIPEVKGADEAQRTLSLLTRNAGRPLEALEKAAVFARLITFGWSEEMIGAKAGIGCKQVKNLLDLAAAPAEVKQMVADKQVSATAATHALQRAPTPQAAVVKLTAAVDAAKAEGKTKATPKAINRPEAPKAPLPTSSAPSRYSTAKVQEFVDTLQEILKLTDVKIIHTMTREVLR